LVGGGVMVGALVPGVDTPPPAAGETAVPPGESVSPTEVTPAPGAVGPAVPVEDVDVAPTAEGAPVDGVEMGCALLAPEMAPGVPGCAGADGVATPPDGELALAVGAPCGPRMLGLPLSAGKGGAGG